MYIICVQTFEARVSHAQTRMHPPLQVRLETGWHWPAKKKQSTLDLVFPTTILSNFMGSSLAIVRF